MDTKPIISLETIHRPEKRQREFFDQRTQQIRLSLLVEIIVKVGAAPVAMIEDEAVNAG